MEKGIARSQFDASLEEDSAQTAGAHIDTTVNVAVVPVRPISMMPCHPTGRD